MSAATIAVLGTFAGVLATLIVGYFTSKGKNKTDSSISHRQSLSTDEQTFRKDLLTEVDAYREKIQTLLGEFDNLSKENTALRVVNAESLVVNIELRGMNTQLRTMNIELLAKIATMQTCIDNNTSHTSSSTTSTETHTTTNPTTNPQIAQ